MSKTLTSNLLDQQSSQDAIVLSYDVASTYSAIVATFSSFKHSATGSVLTDDDAFAQAIRTLGPGHGILVIDDGLTIHLTHTVDVPYSMTITSAAGGRDLGSVVIGPASGDMFHVQAATAVVGLNLVAQAGSGSIFVLTGTGASVIDCNLTNEVGNTSTMVVLQGSGQLLRDDYFSNYEAVAYCWGALEGGAGNSGSSVVGGWAYGPGKGGWIGSTTASSPVSDFTVDGWDCITYGATQLEARAVDGLRVTGGVYDQSTQSAFVLGGGTYGAHQVTIDGAYISTAGNRTTGVAINAAPAGGAGVDGLTIVNNDITCAATGIVADEMTRNVVLTSNTINACSTGLDLGGAAVTAVAVANQNAAVLSHLGQAPAASFSRETGWTVPAVVMPGTYAPGSPSDATASGGSSDGQASLLVSVVAGTVSSQTFLSFKTAPDGSVLSDDDAMARAVSWFSARHGTLVIDAGIVVRLSRTVEIPDSMQLVSDGTSSICFSGGGTCIDVTANGPVLIQGMTLQNDAASGSIVRMGGNTTVLRDVDFRNVLGNTSAMVVFGGPNELVENCNFVNSDPRAYCWSAPYVDVAGQVNINSAVRGGSAVGVGQGGLVGGGTVSGRVEGFEVENWDCRTTGATQIECTDVLALHVRGGSYVNASEATIKLGGGVLGCLSVTIEDTIITGGPESVAIDAAPPGGVGVTALVVSDNQISGSATGLATNIGCGAVSVMGNSIQTSSIGLEVVDTNAPALIADNFITAPIAVQATVAGADWTSQSYTNNVLTGLVRVEHALPGSYTFVGNTGASGYKDSAGVALQPAIPSLVVRAAGDKLDLNGVTNAGMFVTVEMVAGGSRSVVGTVLAGPDGYWALSIASLSVGPCEFMATSSDASGDASVCSAPVAFTGSGASSSAGGTSQLFDEAYYMAHYGAEVTASGLDPFQHYVVVGAKEGLNPNPWFDTSFYLETNPGVAASGINPLADYEAYGWAEGRLPSAVFSAAVYSAAVGGPKNLQSLVDFTKSGSADMADYGPGANVEADILVQPGYVLSQWKATLLPTTGQAEDATAIYKAGGWRTMANPDPMFDTTFYMAAHRDEVAASGLDPLTHYETIGWREGYDPSLVFSTAAYLQAHPFAALAAVDPLTASVIASQPVTHTLALAAPVVTSSVPPVTKLDQLLDTRLVASQIATLLPLGGADPAAVAKAYDEGAWKVVAAPNELFDSVFYLVHNPDVAAAGVDPLRHYETFGAAEGRDPSALFDTNFYLAQNPDVAAAGVNPLLHYETSGWREGRNPDPLFDTKYYLAHNPDVAAAGVNPLLHYETSGWREGRNPDPLFDTKYYLAHNPDVANAGVDPLTHFEAFGWHEGRSPDAFFDVGYYLAHNPDVARAGIDPLAHYETYGWHEGRDPSAAFSTNAYLRANPDVQAAGVDPLAHYLVFGVSEGRAVYAVS